jgi:hypothetical protein
MLQDNKEQGFVVIGYDLREAFDTEKNSPESRSADPMIWISCREISPEKICSLYDETRLCNFSNGLNLAVEPPPSSAPEGFIWTAFDAPWEIVNYMTSSFGLKQSLERESNILTGEGFVLCGYDVIDLWTQFSALFEDDERSLDHPWLYPERYLAWQACDKANELFPERAPFQPVGVWILPNA